MEYSLFHGIRQYAENTGIVVKEINPGVEVQTKEQISAWLKEVGALVFHGMSTCMSSLFYSLNTEWQF